GLSSKLQFRKNPAFPDGSRAPRGLEFDKANCIEMVCASRNNCPAAQFLPPRFGKLLVKKAEMWIENVVAGRSNAAQDMIRYTMQRIGVIKLNKKSLGIQV